MSENRQGAGRDAAERSQGSRESKQFPGEADLQEHSEPDAGSGSSHYSPTLLLGEGKAFQNLGVGCSEPTASQGTRFIQGAGPSSAGTGSKAALHAYLTYL